MADPRYALVGSGEFLPVMEPVDRELLAGRAPRAAVVPTAAALDGDERVRYWLDLGADHYRRIGATAVVVPALDRADCDDAAMAGRLADCGLVYLSGGNPGYLADTLRDTALWRAIVAADRAGAAIAGCSAGAMALTALAPYVERGDRRFVAGLGLLPHVAVIPHFDRIGQWVPGIVDGYLTALTALPARVTLVGIDEDTALVGGPHRWTVRGRQGVHVFRAGGTEVLRAGALVVLDDPATGGPVGP